MSRYLPLIFKILIGFLLAATVFHSYQLRWSGDDIFITLRYIDNFLAGNGLVFNQGEYVEGYTHILWLLILAFFPILTLLLGCLRLLAFENFEIATFLCKLS